MRNRGWNALERVTHHCSINTRVMEKTKIYIQWGGMRSTAFHPKKHSYPTVERCLFLVCSLETTRASHHNQTQFERCGAINCREAARDLGRAERAATDGIPNAPSRYATWRPRVFARF